jgi:ketosteroid isomerase-like protein
MVGAFAPAAHVTTDTDTSAEPESASNESDGIHALIEKWETASRDSLAETAKEVTTDPYAIVKPVEDGADTVRTVSHAQFTAHTQSQAFQALYEQFTPRDPREVEINDVTIEYVGDCLAAAQYTTSEEGENGIHNTKVAAIVVKKDGEWKYAVYTKHATTQS